MKTAVNLLVSLLAWSVCLFSLSMEGFGQEGRLPTRVDSAIDTALSKAYSWLGAQYDEKSIVKDPYYQCVDQAPGCDPWYRKLDIAMELTYTVDEPEVVKSAALKKIVEASKEFVEKVYKKWSKEPVGDKAIETYAAFAYYTLNKAMIQNIVSSYKEEDKGWVAPDAYSKPWFWRKVYNESWPVMALGKYYVQLTVDSRPSTVQRTGDKEQKVEKSGNSGVRKSTVDSQPSAVNSPGDGKLGSQEKLLSSIQKIISTVLSNHVALATRILEGHSISAGSDQTILFNVMFELLKLEKDGYPVSEKSYGDILKRLVQHESQSFKDIARLKQYGDAAGAVILILNFALPYQYDLDSFAQVILETQEKEGFWKGLDLKVGEKTSRGTLITERNKNSLWTSATLGCILALTKYKHFLQREGPR